MPRPRLPNEVLLKIFGYFYEKGVYWEDDLRDVRLASRLFSALANVHFFREVRLDRHSKAPNVKRLRQTVDMLCQPHISMHIRSIAISGKSFFTESAPMDMNSSDPIEEDSEASKVVAFTIDMFRLLSSCRFNLLELKLEKAFLSRSSPLPFDGVLIPEQVMLRVAVEILSTVEFPRLESLVFDSNIFLPLDHIFDMRHQYPDEPGTLQKNIQKIKDISFLLPLNENSESPISSNEVSPASNGSQEGDDGSIAPEKWIKYLNLRRLKISSWCHTNNAIATGYIGRQLGLTQLSLSYVVIDDPLSDTLRRLGRLRRIYLGCIDLRSDKDTWDRIFNALLASKTLRDLTTEHLRYEDRPHGACEFGGLCSPYPADILSYKKLFKRWEDLIAQKCMERRPAAPWGVCHYGNVARLEDPAGCEWD